MHERCRTSHVSSATAQSKGLLARKVEIFDTIAGQGVNLQIEEGNFGLDP